MCELSAHVAFHRATNEHQLEIHVAIQTRRLQKGKRGREGSVGGGAVRPLSPILLILFYVFTYLCFSGFFRSTVNNMFFFSQNQNKVITSDTLTSVNGMLTTWFYKRQLLGLVTFISGTRCEPVVSHETRADW